MNFDIPVKGVTKFNAVIGIGTTIHKFVDANVKDVFLPWIYYHIPTTYVRLFSPQTHHQMHGAYYVIKLFNIKMVLKSHNIAIPINRQEANLPIIYHSYMNSAQKKRRGTLFISGMEVIGLDYLGSFGSIVTDVYSSGTEGEVILTGEFENLSQFCGPCVGSSENKNVTDTQKELLLWPWKLGISMQRIQ